MVCSSLILAVGVATSVDVLGGEVTLLLAWLDCGRAVKTSKTSLNCLSALMEDLMAHSFTHTQTCRDRFPLALPPLVEAILGLFGGTALDAESGQLLRTASGKDHRIVDEKFRGSAQGRRVSNGGVKERMRYLDSSISPAEAKT